MNVMNRNNKKVLFYALPYEKHASGGDVIRKRNLAFLKRWAGDSNVIIHFRPKYTKIARIVYLLQELTGIELRVDKKLFQELRKADIVFIDATNGGTFSSSTLRRAKVISFFHNVEYDYYCQAASNSSTSSVKKKMKYFLHKLVFFSYEKRICMYSDVIITLNRRDSDRLKQLYGRTSDLIIPTSMVDCYKESEPMDSSPYLLFIGSDFFGNTDGLFWFCEQCMPYIKAPLIVAGKGMEKYKARYSSDRISFYGYVDDLASLYRNAVAVVLPILSGSGMKTKTCEAMMHGKVIFGTSESFEGYILSEDCILCNSDTDFIEAINAYLDKGGRLHSTANREVFLHNYESKVVEKNFYDFLNGDIIRYLK